MKTVTAMLFVFSVCLFTKNVALAACNYPAVPLDAMEVRAKGVGAVCGWFINATTRYTYGVLGYH